MLTAIGHALRSGYFNDRSALIRRADNRAATTPQAANVCIHHILGGSEVKSSHKSVAIAVSGAVAAAAAWFMIPYEPTVVPASYAVDLSSPELVAGWADDIFVATVESQESAERDDDGLLYTPFRVAVTSTLDGTVSGDIRVVQEGGDDRVKRQRVVVDGAMGLKPGKTYLLATRSSDQDGWHLVPSNFAPVELPAGEPASSVLATWKSAVASPEMQISVNSPGVSGRPGSSNDPCRNRGSTRRSCEPGRSVW